MLFFLKHESMFQDQAPFLAGLISKNVGKRRYLKNNCINHDCMRTACFFSRIHRLLGQISLWQNVS